MIIYDNLYYHKKYQLDIVIKMIYEYLYLSVLFISNIFILRIQL